VYLQVLSESLLVLRSLSELKRKVPNQHDKALSTKAAELLETKDARCTNKEGLVELERSWVLSHHLIHTVEELDETRRALAVVVVIVAVTDTLRKLMSELKPLALNKNFESLDRAIMWIEHQQSTSDKLRRAVPPIAAPVSDAQLSGQTCSEPSRLRRPANNS
jgi:hypothetical protein